MPDLPSLEEAILIVKRREALAEVLHGTVIGAIYGSSMESALPGLMKRFSIDEIHFVAEVMEKRSAADEALNRLSKAERARQSYEEYLRRHARFGGQRPRMTPARFARAAKERLCLISHQMAGIKPGAAERRRVKALDDSMLRNVDLWEDVLPEDPPPCPSHKQERTSDTQL